MLRCRRCNQVVAAFGVACICGEIVISVAKVGVRLYTNPDLHAHNEQKAPPQTRPSVVIVTTSSSGDTNGPRAVVGALSITLS
jgi:hypothetical protein